MPVSPAEREYVLSQIGRFAETDLNNLWRQAEQLGTEEFFAYVRDGFVELANGYHQTTGQLAATWFEESDLGSSFVARVAEPITPDRLLNSANWALGGDGVQGLARMQGSMQRAVYDGARDTVVLNAEATRSRWIRVARANACEFCRMLATRSGDYAYLTRESAQTVTGTLARNRRKGARKMGSKFHDDCYCTAVEVRDNQSVEDVLTEDKLRLYEQWSDEYDKAVANAGTTDTKKVLAAWREQTASTPPATPASGPLDRAVLDSANSVEQAAIYIRAKHGISVDALIDSPLSRGVPIEESIRRGTDPLRAAKAAKPHYIDARTAREMAQAVDDVLEKYPFLELDELAADFYPVGNPLGSMAHAKVKLDQNGKWVGAQRVTINQFADAEGDKPGTSYERYVQWALSDANDEGYKAETAKRPVYAVIVHEMGHVVDFNSGGSARQKAALALREYILQTPEAQKLRQKILDEKPGAFERLYGNRLEITPEYEKLEKRWLKKNLVSAYSFTDSDRNKSINLTEALAEAFADVELRGDKATQASKIIHKAMLDAAREYRTPPKSTLELLNEIQLPGVSQ